MTDLNTAAGGASFLDERAPEGWYNIVDPDRLDQSDADECVLGQVYGYYDDGVEELGIGYGRSAFDGRVSTAAWVEEIEKRRNTIAAPMGNNVEMKRGRTYRFTVEAEFYKSIRTSSYRFRDTDGCFFDIDKERVSNIEEVHEVKSGDVYMRDGEVYHVKNVSLYGATFRAGDQSHYVTSECNFTANELIYRRDS